MKKALFLVGFVLMVLCLASCLNGSSGTELPQSIAPELLQKSVPRDYTDLGLSSKTKWKKVNEGNSKLFTYEEAIEAFGDKIPTKAQWMELVNECSWVWTGMGYKVVGPNGKSIVLPAWGCRYDGVVKYEGECGLYWSFNPADFDYAWIFAFDSDEMRLGTALHCSGLSVRLVEE